MRGGRGVAPLVLQEARAQPQARDSARALHRRSCLATGYDICVYGTVDESWPPLSVLQISVQIDYRFFFTFDYFHNYDIFAILKG